MSGNCNADTCNLKACRLSATINSLGCPQSSTEHEFNRAETHDSYTTRWDTIWNTEELRCESHCSNAQCACRRYCGTPREPPNDPKSTIPLCTFFNSARNRGNRRSLLAGTDRARCPPNG